MTNEEAINILRPIAERRMTFRIGNKAMQAAPDDIDTALRLAIKALERDRWISVEEPPDNDRNIFICHGSHNFKAPCIGHYEAGMKLFYEDRNWFASPVYDAMYWCEMPRLPLPEPPKEET